MTTKSIEFGNKLVELLEQNNMTQRELARKLYLSDASLSHYIKGRSLPTYEILTKIADVFSVSIDYLLNIDASKNNISTETINVPVFRDLTYNDSFAADSPNVEFIFPVNTERYKDCNRLFAKIVTTDEMYPRIMIGDIIIFEELKLGTDKIFNGDICLVSKGDDIAKIREMANTNDGYVFNPFNVDMPPRVYDMDRIRKENVHIIARAVKLIHEFKKRG